MKKDARNVGLDRIRTLVSMVIDSSNRDIIEKKSCQHTGAFIFDLIFNILAGNKDNHYISDEVEIWLDRNKNSGVSCP